MPVYYPLPDPSFHGAQQPFTPRKLNPALLDNPPSFVAWPRRIALLMAVVAAWQSDPGNYAEAGGGKYAQQPYGQRQLNPSLIAVPADNPPFGLLETLAEAWAANPPLPQQTRYLNPLITGVPVDNPPFGLLDTLWQPWQPPDPAATQARKLNPSLLASVTDNPPFRHPGRWGQTVTATFAWQPPDPPPTQAHKLYPSLLAADNPQAELSGFEIWEVLRPLPQQAKKLNPALFATIDDPPFRHPSRWGQTVTAVYAWQPSDPQPTQRGPFNPSITVALDNLPFRHAGRWLQQTTVVFAWVPPDPQPTQKAPISPAIIPVPPPVTPGEFTVSGRDVSDIFPVYDVVYSYAPITKRTN